MVEMVKSPRDENGKFKKGFSGNPRGGSKKRREQLKTVSELRKWLIDIDALFSDESVAHPLVVLIRMASNPAVSDGLRIKAASYALPYLLDSKQAQVLPNSGNGTTNVQINLLSEPAQNQNAELVHNQILMEETKAEDLIPSFPNAEIEHK